VFVALATATRIAGLALIPAIVWEAYREYRVTKKIPISIVLAPLGFIFYSTYIQIISGNALLIITQQKNWNKPVGILGPWFALKDGFSKAFFGSEFSRHNPLSHFIEQVEFVSIIFIIVVIITSIKKMRFSYWLYIFFSTALILFSGVLSSVHRYLVVLFPIYIYLVKVIPKKYFLFLCFIFVLLLLVLSCLFLRNYWVA